MPECQSSIRPNDGGPVRDNFHEQLILGYSGIDTEMRADSNQFETLNGTTIYIVTAFSLSASLKFDVTVGR